MNKYELALVVNAKTKMKLVQQLWKKQKATSPVTTEM